MGDITSLVSINLQDCTDITGEPDRFVLLSFFLSDPSSGSFFSALFTALGIVVALSSHVHQMLGELSQMLLD